MENARERLKRQVAETENAFGVTEWPQEKWREIAQAAGSLSQSLADADDSLDRVRGEVASCQQCRLAPTRTQTVFGEGNPRAELMFIGEAPGFDEDREGKPFVGKAGQLLTRMIEAMGLTRKDVYIANCLKCRPPDNRNPLPDELSFCRSYLDRQIKLVKPKVICALGKFAAQSLLKSETPISRLRGQFGAYQGVPVMPTFHPAYLLRNPDDKKLVWEDLKQIMRCMGLPTVKP